MSSTTPIPTGAIRLTWLREDRPHHLQSTFGLEVQPDHLVSALASLSADIPANAIECLAANIMETIDGAPEVHLPYIARHDWRDRAAILARTQFERTGIRLLPRACTERHSEKLRHDLRLFSTAVHRDGAGATIEFVAPFMRAAACVSEVHAWMHAPRERHPLYYRAHMPVSLAIQRTLRKALHQRWLSSVANCERIEETCAVLAYVSSAPFTGRHRTDFTYDIIKPAWFSTALRNAQRPLASLLSGTANLLDLSGAPSLAREYRNLDVKLLLRRMCERQRLIQAIVANEERLINGILLFGTGVSKSSGPKALYYALDALRRELEPRLRRLCREDLSDLFPLLLIEATRALSTSLRGTQLDWRKAA